MSQWTSRSGDGHGPGICTKALGTDWLGKGRRATRNISTSTFKENRRIWLRKSTNLIDFRAICPIRGLCEPTTKELDNLLSNEVAPMMIHQLDVPEDAIRALNCTRICRMMDLQAQARAMKESVAVLAHEHALGIRRDPASDTQTLGRRRMSLIRDGLHINWVSKR